MPDPGSVAWLLDPPQLIAACALLGIAGLPHSTYVRTDEDQPAYVESVGLRALAISRLTVDGDDGPAVEPRLAAALIALTGEDHDVLASLSWHRDERHVAVVTGASAATMIESFAGIEVIVEPATAALLRLEHRTLEAHELAQARRSCSEPESAGRDSIPLDRWEAIRDGRPVRSTDAPLGARAAQAAAEGILWEGACVRLTEDGYDGEALSWTSDDRGVLMVEVGQEAVNDDSPVLDVSTVDDLLATLEPLWQPLREYVGPQQDRIV